jgi:hypothetical protein
MWGAWHHRNNVVHGDMKASEAASVPFILNYYQSFSTATAKNHSSTGKLDILPDLDTSTAGPSSTAS